jgi:predicted amidohydrolase
MHDLRVTAVQSAIHWHDAGKNWAMFDQALDGVETDLVVLPEMFNVGFTQHPDKAAETMDGPTVAWVSKLAARLDAAVTGSLAVKENGQYFNRMLFVTPDGEVDWYDKRHLFRMAGEHLRYGEGTRRKIIIWRGWRINLQVCYDLRFPVWSRRGQGDADYDLLLYVANWPAVRSFPWTSLLVARAIENLSYVVGVNRVGEDENSLHYSGDSVVLSPQGEALWSSKDTACVHTEALSASELQSFREAFPAHQDADEFNISS